MKNSLCILFSQLPLDREFEDQGFSVVLFGGNKQGNVQVDQSTALTIAIQDIDSEECF